MLAVIQLVNDPVADKLIIPIIIKTTASIPISSNLIKYIKVLCHTKLHKTTATIYPFDTKNKLN